MEKMNAETAKIFDDAAAEMFRRKLQVITLEVDLNTLVGLIGNLQLSFRHPANVGSTRVKMEEFVRDLIERLDPERGALYQLLMLGFDKNFDME